MINIVDFTCFSGKATRPTLRTKTTQQRTVVTTTWVSRFVIRTKIWKPIQGPIARIVIAVTSRMYAFLNQYKMWNIIFKECSFFSTTGYFTTIWSKSLFGLFFAKVQQFLFLKTAIVIFSKVKVNFMCSGFLIVFSIMFSSSSTCWSLLLKCKNAKTG